nr:uncharacterized protein LOC124815120 [Hydra vulgaris]
MSKALYYLKMYLLLEAIPSLSEENKEEIREMAMFVGIFYTQWFLRAVSATAAPYQDMKALWQMKRFMDINLLGATLAIKSFDRHSWYLDPALVVLALADKHCPNSEDIVTSLYNKLPIKPIVYPLERVMVNKEVLHSLDFSQDQPPSLCSLITEQSWLIFDKMEHRKGELQWLKIPSQFWKFNDFYLEFESTIKSLDVVRQRGP